MFFKRIGTSVLACLVAGGNQMVMAQEDLGLWELKADIYPNDPSGSDPNLSPDYGFGWSVDFSGGILIVGSYRAGKWDPDIGAHLPGGGSARVFVQTDSTSNTGWGQQGPPLVVSDGEGEEYVGYRVAIDGDRALIAAGRGQGYGLVKLFVFERNNGSWSQTAMLEFPDEYNDNGEIPRVALEGNIAVVGRPFPTNGVGSGNANGKVFVYTYDEIMGVWNATSTILEAPDSDRKDGDYFGVDVAISNGIILVGADESMAWNSTANEYIVDRKGKAYIFVDNDDGNGWVHSQTLEQDSALALHGFQFGSFVALDGDTALIGNNYDGWREENGYCVSSIPVYEYTRNGAGYWEWTNTFYSDSVQDYNLCHFGNTGVALKGNRVLIGAKGYGAQALLFEDGMFVSWLYPFGDHYGSSDSSYRHGNWFALGTDSAFIGTDRGFSSGLTNPGVGSLHVYDSFSEIPLGEEVLTYVSSQAWRTSFSVTYNAGHGHQVQAELFKSDCATPIENWDVVGWWDLQSGWRKNLTIDTWEFHYQLHDVTRINEIGIYNPDTWQLEICHKVRLVSASTVEVLEQILSIDINLVPEGVIAGSFGDPHIITFDKLKFDCQAAGVFTMLASLEDATFKIQERFTAVSSGTCSQASVSTGVAVTDTGKPIIQISTPGIGESSLNNFFGLSGGVTCPIDFFVDGTAFVLDATDLSDHNIIVKRDKYDKNRIKIIYTDTLLTVDALVRSSQSFGCHLMVVVGLPNTYRIDDSLVGLLGTPNGDMGDDWVARDGSAIEVPANEADRIFSTAYGYCIDNWCVQVSADSLFTLRPGESFEEINQCGVAYSGGDIEAAMEALIAEDASINQGLLDTCTAADFHGSTTLSLSCMVDGICGSISDAYVINSDRWNWIYWSEEASSSEFSPLKANSTPWEVKAEISPQDSEDFTSVAGLSPDYGFGWSVAVSGDTIIVGSYNSAEIVDQETQTYGPGQGSARVFQRSDQSSNSSWEQVGDPLIVTDSSNPNAKYIGYRVAIDGPTAIIAATRDDNGVKKSKVFVFEFNASNHGSWEQTAMLPFESLDDGHIPQVALQGDTAIVGAGYLGKGRVFVFKKIQSWAEVEIETLVASDGKSGDYFGADVSISGNAILIGASQRDLKDLSDGTTISRVGKAYIFVNNNDGNGWVEEAIVKPEQYASAQLQFGAAVSLDGDTAFIGHGNFYGNVYVYQKHLGVWTFVEKLYAPKTSSGYSFGKSVVVRGDLAIVCGEYDGPILYERKRSGWSVKSLLKDYMYSSRHGKIVALGTDFAVVATDEGEWNVGKVRVFDDFSVVPPGPEKIHLEYNDTFASPVEVDFYVVYVVGYSYELDFKLFEKDCQTPIAENLVNSTEVYTGSVSLSESYHSYWTRFNPEAVVDSVVHNKVTWEIEICAVASLIDSPSGVTSVNVFKIPFFEGAPSGVTDIIFKSSWTSANGIWLEYLIGRDRQHTAQLYQKDCQTPIDDTDITNGGSWISPLSYEYDKGQFGYILDPNTIRDSVIFDSENSEIEFCHVVTLIDAPDVVDRQVIRIFVEPPGTFAGLFGDPHIMTFDELSYDCQAAGEFTILTSLENDSFKIQERFTAIESGGTNTCQASVSTGVAVADVGKPTIQISTPRYGGTSQNAVNGCPIDFLVDGFASILLGNDLSGSNIEVTLEEETRTIRIKHTDTLLILVVNVRNSTSFGCHIMVQVSIPTLFRHGETLLGLLGTPNGDNFDDWRMPNGTVITAPTSDAERLFSTAYNYCVDNWCAKSESDSLFVYGEGESFDIINKCDVPFSSEVETALNDPDSFLDPDLVNACGGSFVCLVDGFCGDIGDALAAASEEQDIVRTQVALKTTSIIFPSERTEVENVQAMLNATDCVGIHLSDFDQLQLNASCSLIDRGMDSAGMFDLICGALVPSNLSSCGTIKTSLTEGACVAGNPATIVGSTQSTSFNGDYDCKNSGQCEFVHCFRIDYWYKNIGILSEMHEIVSTLMYARDGTWTAQVQTAPFNAVDATAAATVAPEVSARIGHCNIVAGDGGDVGEVVIGSTLAICIHITNTTNENVMLTLKDVTGNPGGQTLVNANGSPNFVTKITDHGSSGVTLETLMVPAYYDAQGGMAGSVTFEGMAEVSYLNPNRHLVGGRALEKVKEDRFILEVKVVREKDPDVTEVKQAVEEISAGMGCCGTASVAVAIMGMLGVAIVLISLL